MNTNEIVAKTVFIAVITLVYAGICWLKDHFLAKHLGKFTNRFVDYTLVYVAAVFYCYVLQ